jgi:hypothetical protein
LAGFAGGALEGSHSVRILMFLHRQSRPVMTKEIMESLGIRNWSTATSILQRLGEARLVSMEEVNVGRYKSRAKFWRIEPHFGVKVAAALENVERWSMEASSGMLPSSERRGIVDIESPAEKLVMVVQNAIKTAIGGA